MAEYIDRKALLEKLCDGDASRMEDFYYNAIADFPAADMVEVVRCRDCKHLYCCSAVDRLFFCRNYPHGLKGCLNVVEENPYCSYGERRAE